MKFFHLAQLFMYWGKYIKPSELANFRGYLSKMLSRNRVMAIFDGPNIQCVLFYFITDELDSFIGKKNWSVPTDNENGHILFIDKLISKSWKPSIRRSLKLEIKSKFPLVNRVIWVTEPFNRSVIINIGDSYAAQRL